jgi:hypothetical protein
MRPVSQMWKLTEIMNDLPKITQVINGNTELCTQVCQIPEVTLLTIMPDHTLEQWRAYHKHLTF